MRRFLNTKLTIIALVFSIVTLITGVTLTVISAAPNSSPNKQIDSAAAAEVQAIPTLVQEGGSVRVAGAGFVPGQFVLFEIIVGGDVPPIILGSGQANDAGAFVKDTAGSFPGGVLPATLTAGNTYTIKASVTARAGGHVASAPLVIVDEEPK